MSVERRSIGAPPLRLNALPDVVPPSAEPEKAALITPHAPLAPQGTRVTLPASPAESPQAVRARVGRFERVTKRMLAAGGEDPEVLANHFKRFAAATTAPTGRVFTGGNPMLELYVNHATLEIRKDDVCIAAVADRPTEQLGVLAAITHKSEPVGFFIQTLGVENGKRFDYLDFAVVNPDRGSALGIGQELTALVDRLATAAGSTESRLKTAWVGRYYWAQKRYDFATPAERDRVVEHFRRFIAHYNIAESDLRIGDKPFSFEALKHSWDIAAVESVRGPVEVPGLVAADQEKNVIAAVGKAFYLGNWGNTEVGQGGADLFVRNWDGVRQRS